MYYHHRVCSGSYRKESTFFKCHIIAHGFVLLNRGFYHVPKVACKRVGSKKAKNMIAQDSRTRPRHEIRCSRVLSQKWPLQRLTSPTEALSATSQKDGELALRYAAKIHDFILLVSNLVPKK